MRYDNSRVTRLIAGCVLAAAAIVLYAGAGGAQSATLPLIVLEPGATTTPDIELNKVQTTAGNYGHGSVSLDAGFNKIAVAASAAFCASRQCILHPNAFGRTTSGRRVQMYRDFCVPNPDADNCTSGISSNPGEDLIATVSFDTTRIWQFQTFASGTATFKAHVEIIDLDDGNRRVAYQRLDDESQGSFLGKIQTIAKVPVPIPQFDGEQIVQPVVFTIRLRRGHEHRLILTAAATADSGVRPLGSAEIHMGANLVGANPGGVEVQNLAITVAPSAEDRFTALEERVTALEQAVGNQPAAADALSDSFDEKMGGLSGGVSDLTLDVEDVKTQIQSTQAELAAAIESTQASLSAAIQATQSDVAGVQTRVGGLETQVGTMQIQFNGHTHDCVVLRPADGANGIGRGLSGQFTISCGAAKQP